MKDPGNPRAVLRGEESEAGAGDRSLDLIENLSVMLRGACLLGVSLLLAIAAYYALGVFVQLGR